MVDFKFILEVVISRIDILKSLIINVNDKFIYFF